MDWSVIAGIAIGVLISELILLPAIRALWPKLRRSLSRRWLRKRLESYEVQDKEWASEPRSCLHNGANVNLLWGEREQTATCKACGIVLELVIANPQPPSQPPSAQSSGAEAGKSGG